MKRKSVIENTGETVVGEPNINNTDCNIVGEPKLSRTIKGKGKENKYGF